jgi:ElaB/YqjD/DUF883 family membrane-anchored ribosome-binding protein
MDQDNPMISIARDRATSRSGDLEDGGGLLAQAQGYLAETGEFVKDLVTNRPALALGVALAAGVFLGWLIKRR